jgi:methyl-accepting chemotaxis protein
MTANKKASSKKMTSKAAQILNDDSASKTAKSLAASVLAQADSTKQTSAKMEEVAAKVLQSDKYSNETKSLAGSALSQANKER